MDEEQEKFWDNLTKEYLTTDQKLAIIREHNQNINDKNWEECLEHIREWVEKSK